jgi:hypothetical protein
MKLELELELTFPITWMYEEIYLLVFFLAVVHHGNCDRTFCFAQFWVMHATGHLHSLCVGITIEARSLYQGRVLISVGRFRVLSRVPIRIQSSEFCPNWIRVQIWVPLTSWGNPKPKLIELLCFLLSFFLGKMSMFFTYQRTRFLNRWES